MRSNKTTGQYIINVTDLIKIKIDEPSILSSIPLIPKVLTQFSLKDTFNLYYRNNLKKFNVYGDAAINFYNRRYPPICEMKYYNNLNLRYKTWDPNTDSMKIYDSNISNINFKPLVIELD